MFTTKGFSKTSISEIVEKAGVAKGTFYLYFKDKYDIKNKLITHKSTQIFKTALEELEKYPELDFQDRIIFIINNIVNQLNEDKSLLKFISKTLAGAYLKTLLFPVIRRTSVSLIFMTKCLKTLPKSCTILK